MQSSIAQAYVNGIFLPLAEAQISVMDRGFLFADGVYEVVAVLNGRLVDAAGHMARLARSLDQISIDLPASIDRIIEIHHELIARAALQEGLIYLQVTRGVSPVRDFAFPQNTPPTLVLFTHAKPVIDNPAARNGISVKTVADIRWGRRDIKSLMLLAQVLAKNEAAVAGADDAWLIEPDGTVTESAAATAFIIKDGVVRTRPNSNTILPGCTRKALESLAAEQGIQIEDRAFTVTEALAADEAFCTFATAFVLRWLKSMASRLALVSQAP